MSTCSTCNEKSEIICKTCDKTYCAKCSKQKHMNTIELLQHHSYIQCEECEDNEAKLFCPSCEQNLCTSCDNRIHNKGKRALHNRDNLNYQDPLSILSTLAIITEDILLANFPLINQTKSRAKIESLNECQFENKQNSNVQLERNGDDDEIIKCFSGFIRESIIKKHGINPEQLLIIFVCSIDKGLTDYEWFINGLRKDYPMVIKLIKNTIGVINREGISNINHDNEDQLKLKEKFDQRNEEIENNMTRLLNKAYLLSKFVLMDVNNSTGLLLLIQKILNFDPKYTLYKCNEKINKPELTEISWPSTNNTNSIPMGSTGREGKGGTDSNDYKIMVINPQNHQVQKQDYLRLHQEEIYTLNEQLPSLDLKIQNGCVGSLNKIDSLNIRNVANADDFPINGVYPHYTDHLHQHNESFDTSNFITLNHTSDNISKDVFHTSFDHPKSNVSKGINNGNNVLPVHRNINTLTQDYLYQYNKEIEIDESLKLSHYIQNELRSFAQDGDIILSREAFLTHISHAIENKFFRNPENVVKKAEEAGIIHTIVRKFTDRLSFNYIGLHLDNLTVESLVWILKSLKKDSMTPTEKIILSRIKEAFGLKIDAKYWKILLNYLIKIENDARCKTNFMNEKQLPNLSILKAFDPTLNSDIYIIYLKNDEWIPEDQGTLDENSELWKVFLEFIENFFKTDQPINQNDSNGHQANEIENKSSKSPCIITQDNSANQSSRVMLNSEYVDYKKIKAIPGGRYGCAQFLKICGPEPIRKISLGKINLFIQEAIKKRIMRYQKTLLIKNDPNSNFSELEDLSQVHLQISGNNSLKPEIEEKSKELNKIKQALYEILSENPNGLSLAQIPQNLRKKLDFQLNLQKLGFPKLKNLLETMSDDIKIELSGTNHSFAILKNSLIQKNSKLNEKNAYLNSQEENHNINTATAGGALLSSRQASHNNLDMILHPLKITPSGKGSTAYSEGSEQIYPEYSSIGQSNSSDIINCSLGLINISMNSDKDTVLKKTNKNPTKSSLTSNSNDNQGGKKAAVSKYKIYSTKKFSTFTPSSDAKCNKINRKNISTLEEYLNKVRHIIESIINDNRFGLSIDKLYECLTNKLGFNFDVRLFQCKDFYEFLFNFCENLVDIEIKRNMMFENKITLMIYPKNFRFGPGSKFIDNNQYTGTTSNNNGHISNNNNNNNISTKMMLNIENKHQKVQNNHLLDHNNHLDNLKTQTHHYNQNINIASVNKANAYNNHEPRHNNYDQMDKCNQYNIQNIPYDKKENHERCLNDLSPNNLNSDSIPFLSQGNYPTITSSKFNKKPLPFQQYFQMYGHAMPLNQNRYNNLMPPNQNILHLSPKIFYGDNEDFYARTPDGKQGIAHDRNISYWNLNFGGSNDLNMNNCQGSGIRLISNINTVIHSRNESKTTLLIPEESNIEINENLKFIEELLNDNGENKSGEVNLTLDKDNLSWDMKSPNFSLTSLSGSAARNINSNSGNINFNAIPFSSDNAFQNFVKLNHNKRLSEDFNLPTGSGSKFVNTKQHARFNSVIEIREIDASENDNTPRMKHN